MKSKAKCGCTPQPVADKQLPKGDFEHPVLGLFPATRLTHSSGVVVHYNELAAAYAKASEERGSIFPKVAPSMVGVQPNLLSEILKQIEI